MLKIMKYLIFKIGYIYGKFQYLIMSIAVIGILDFLVYYELAVSMMALLAPELAPVVLLIIAWLMYKGIKKFIETRRGKKYSFF
ncbi:hypothetical protein [Paenibacillus chibensis]|uniref:hypothetical protein n=1 Tax=Paenibacillus chibensis TaxID=59846 RepID=UPI000FDB8747|nr:hypothetical protein [Paenibacillus chibensis]MEC0370396.1 hypothetical protein [Paenibacillus chibensis]